MSNDTIAGKSFKTKTEIIEHVREILRKYEDYEELKEPDFKFIYDLLQRHHNVEEKIGCGIRTIRKVTSIYGKNAFEIVRIDNTKTDFSFMHCINPKNPLSDLKQACRNAIKEQTIHFREEAFKEKEFLLCPLTGQRISMYNSHVDHQPPHTFDWIFKEWLKTYQIDPKNVKIRGYSDGEQEKYFEDSSIRNSFIDLHNRFAQLRITSIPGNLSHSKKEVAGC